MIIIIFRMKVDDGPNFSILDEELYEGDEEEPSPFQRSTSKSMILDDRWGEWEDKMKNIVREREREREREDIWWRERDIEKGED